jgi:ornithine carbamoyltransferase
MCKELRATRALPYRHALEGRVIALFFRKASTRTRVTFESAAARLGATSLFLREADVQLGRGESIEDTARVLSGYVDAIVIRTFGHDELERWAQAADVPVLNALTDLAHPTQVIADLLTVEDRFGQLQGLKLAYVGDGNNMANSYLIGAALAGVDLAVATPPGFEPPAAVVAKAQALAQRTGAHLSVGHDAASAVQGAHAVLTDVWASMGQEAEAEARKAIFAPYAVTEQLFGQADRDAVFLHGLPAHRGEEVTAEVIDGPRSVVMAEAHNRLWVEAALLLGLIGVDV